MRRFVRESSLSIAFGLMFLAALVGQAVAGWKQVNAEQVAEGLGTVTLPQYLTSADFAVDVAENWQSEYLQFLLYLLLTVWLLQKGSPESKELDQGRSRVPEGTEDRAVRDRGLPTLGSGRRLAHQRVLLVAGARHGRHLPGLLAGPVIAGWAAFNETRLERLQDPVGWGAYLVRLD